MAVKGRRRLSCLPSTRRPIASPSLKARKSSLARVPGLPGGWTTLSSIRADRVGAWLLDNKRNGVPERDGKRKASLPSDRTVDQYLESVRAFLKWCVSSGYLVDDPLLSVKKVRRPKKVRRRR